jgi:hypothetical protein
MSIGSKSRTTTLVCFFSALVYAATGFVGSKTKETAFPKSHTPLDFVPAGKAILRDCRKKRFQNAGVHEGPPENLEIAVFK